jgi:hypothetical protein
MGDERDVPHYCVERKQSQEKPVKMIVSLLIALSVLTVMASQASAWDSQKFFEELQDRGG